MYYMGIDIGSLSCDAVIVDGGGAIRGSSVVPTGARNAVAIERARSEAVANAGIGPAQVASVVSTGYGRDRVEGRTAAVTEITCHAKGIQKLFPKTSLLIDIGGQDSKAILFDGDGMVSDFAMNDKCAAGTGRFLEAMARALEIDVGELGRLDPGTSSGLKMSSMCTVFAESEVVSLIAGGADAGQIVNAIHRAIASRVCSLAKRVAQSTAGQNVSMSGGVAYNAGVVRALGEALGTVVNVPEKPDIVGAYGAALIALERSKAVQ
jgi:predicted CoA-substrate-specific enzyme activase